MAATLVGGNTNKCSESQRKLSRGRGWVGGSRVERYCGANNRVMVRGLIFSPGAAENAEKTTLEKSE